MVPINIVICRSFIVLQKLESCVRDTQERTFVIKLRGLYTRVLSEGATLIL